MPLGLIDRHNPQSRPAEAPRIEADEGQISAQRDLDRTAELYQPSKALVDAINVALTLGAPLLLTGKPGTGKTQVAFYLRWFLHVDPSHFHIHPIKSTSTADELTYTVDEIRYFHAAHTSKEPIERREFIEPGPLWKAFDSPERSIVLIDEIDKAPRDFPNDLLFVLDQRRFRVPEHDERNAKGAVTRRHWHKAKPGVPPPIIVITSNSERRLPEPFLRRCIFHHIVLDDSLRERAVLAHLESLEHIEEPLAKVGLELTKRIEKRGARAPSTAEIIMWLSFLDALAHAGTPVTVEQIRDAHLHEVPGIASLVKDGADFDRLRRGRG